METIIVKSATNELIKHIYRLGGYRPIESLMSEAAAFITEHDRLINPILEVEEDLHGPIYLGPPEEKECCHDCGKRFPANNMFRFFTNNHGEYLHVCRECWKKPKNIERHAEKTPSWIDNLIE